MIRVERIKERMDALGLSQAELARRVGIKQPSIHALISGENKRGSAHLHRIARELGTTPAYLSGETDDPSGGALELRLSSDESTLLDIYRRLAQKDRVLFQRMMRTLADPPGDGGTKK